MSFDVFNIGSRQGQVNRNLASFLETIARHCFASPDLDDVMNGRPRVIRKARRGQQINLAQTEKKRLTRFGPVWPPFALARVASISGASGLGQRLRHKENGLCQEGVRKAPEMCRRPEASRLEASNPLGAVCRNFCQRPKNWAIWAEGQQSTSRKRRGAGCQQASGLGLCCQRP